MKSVARIRRNAKSTTYMDKHRKLKRTTDKAVLEHNIVLKRRLEETQARLEEALERIASLEAAAAATR
jgi:hypothetical protein